MVHPQIDLSVHSTLGRILFHSYLATSIHSDCIALPTQYIWSNKMSGDNEDQQVEVKKPFVHEEGVPGLSRMFITRQTVHAH